MLSEAQSATGITYESMNNIMGQVHTLAETMGVDINSIFTYSANGIKLNINAMRNLVNLQSDAYSTYLNSAIEQQTQLIEEQTAQITKNSRETVEAEKKKLKSLQNELNTYNAITKALKDSLSGYSQWQSAKSAGNPGARYDEILSALPEIERQINQGIITPEIEKFIQMLSPTGTGTIAEWNRMKASLLDVFDVSDEGIKRFMDKLINGGLATMVDGQYKITANLDDIVEIEGISPEAVRNIFDKISEYGYNVNVVLDENDAKAQLDEAYSALDEEIIRRATLTDPLQIEQSNKKIEEFKARIDELYGVWQGFASQPLVRDQEFNDVIAQIKALQKEAVTDEYGYDRKDLVNNIASAYGIELDERGYILTKTAEEASANLEKARENFVEEITEEPMNVKIDEESIQSMSDAISEAITGTEENMEVSITPNSEVLTQGV